MGRRRIPRIEGTVPAGARRLRDLVPDDELDLHGLTVDRAVSRVGFFLERAARVHPGGVVRVITGRGLHSTNGPRLRDAVRNHLDESPVALDVEPSDDLGSFVVRLARI
jgi:DNA-nicking Smr family endonuclease